MFEWNDCGAQTGLSSLQALSLIIDHTIPTSRPSIATSRSLATHRCGATCACKTGTSESSASKWTGVNQWPCCAFIRCLMLLLTDRCLFHMELAYVCTAVYLVNALQNLFGAPSRFPMRLQKPLDEHSWTLHGYRKHFFTSRQA